MHLKDSMKLAAAVVGTAITGKAINVSRKVLPIRGNYPKAEGLLFTSRFIFDGRGRRIEELHIISGAMPLGSTRFYWAGQIEIERNGQRVVASYGSNLAIGAQVHVYEPVPINARSAIEAFKEYDSILKALADDFQKKLDEAENG